MFSPFTLKISYSVMQPDVSYEDLSSETGISEAFDKEGVRIIVINVFSQRGSVKRKKRRSELL